MGKSTVSTAMFNSYLTNYQRVVDILTQMGMLTPGTASEKKLANGINWYINPYGQLEG